MPRPVPSRFFVTPHSRSRSLPNVARFTLEGDLADPQDRQRLQDLLDLAVAEGVILTFGRDSD